MYIFFCWSYRPEQRRKRVVPWCKPSPSDTVDFFVQSYCMASTKYHIPKAVRFSCLTKPSLHHVVGPQFDMDITLDMRLPLHLQPLPGCETLPTIPTIRHACDNVFGPIHLRGILCEEVSGQHVKRLPIDADRDRKSLTTEKRLESGTAVT
jgi:hypothetical protein